MISFFMPKINCFQALYVSVINHGSTPQLLGMGRNFLNLIYYQEASVASVFTCCEAAII